ncbi:MAG TPA: methyltransferase [Ktedonobacteraceae bacterium]|nr:methyltransferase [Ktedonobacteraceae bacterium]
MDQDVTNVSAPSAPQALLQMLGGAILTQAIHMAALLNLADLVKDAPKSLHELSEATGVPSRSLTRLLRPLVTVGIFTENEPGVYRQSELSSLLRSDIPYSMRDIALMYGDEWQWRPWEEFRYSLQTEKPAFEHLYGMSLWQYFHQQKPDSGRIFDAAMTNLTKQVNLAIASAYDFSQFRRIADIGGGEGSLLRTILRKHPSPEGVLFDQPSVLERAHALFAEEGLTRRCTFVPGTFLEAIPVEADAYVIKHILKGWRDDEAIGILCNCRQAMKPGSKLLVVEHLFSSTGMLFEKLVDLQLLLVTTGGERSEEEYRKLFQAAGFSMSVVPTSTPNAILEGTLLVA